jgi:CBS domain containing-hemolysin-like protein
MEFDFSTRVIAILFLILFSAYFSVTEIALAASHKLRLQQMTDQGDKRAKLVLDLQEKPGPFFSVIQIGLNAIAILGGIVGEAVLSPVFYKLLSLFLSEKTSANWAFVCSFFIVTMIFVLFADLIPKRIALANPEAIAVRVIRSMNFMIFVLKPFVWLLTAVSNRIMKLLGVPIVNRRVMTSEDLLATLDAGAQAGILDSNERSAIENVIGMEDRLVTTAMTPRDSCVFFTLDDDFNTIRRKIESNPHSKFLLCDKDIDHVIGYVDSKMLLTRMIANDRFSLADKSLIHSVPTVPDSLSLSEVLEVYRKQGEDFAVVINEYALTLGIVTLQDVMSTVMGDLVPLPEEDTLIVHRDEHTWLIDGTAPIVDVGRELDIEEWPREGMYETLAGFMIVLLRKVPKVTDKVVYDGYQFEVIDVERNRIDQILVTKLEKKEVKEETADSGETTESGPKGTEVP